MSSITEQVIRDQLPYVAAALRQPMEPLPGTTLVFVGCGTSFHLAATLAAASNGLGRRAVAVPGAEWVQRPGCYLADAAGATVIGLSRSGTTTETLQALRAAKASGLGTVALSCEAGSTILEEADRAVHLPTDEREGIVMTVSASLMLAAGLRLIGVPVPGSVVDDMANVLAGMDAGRDALLEGRSHFAMLGAAPLYGIACEAALKLQEMALGHAQAFHPMEFRHGPVSLIDEASLVTLLYSADSLDEEAGVAADVRALGATVIGLGGPGDLSLAVESTGAAVALALLPALQLLGEKVARAKHLDTEAPRHLSKVVVLD